MTTETERIARMEEKIISIDEKLEKQCLQQKEDSNKILKKLDDMESRFAGKWVENVAIGILITCIGSLLIAITVGILHL